MTIEGGCCCGEVRYRIEGKPRSIAHCHCLHCRRTSGAPFLTWAGFALREFTFHRGRPEEYSSRAEVTRTFCARCGTQLTYQHRDEKETIDVTVCSMDNPETLKPQHHIWCGRKLPWIRLDDGLPRYPLRRDS